MKKDTFISPGALFGINPSRFIFLIIFYLAPRLAN